MWNKIKTWGGKICENNASFCRMWGWLAVCAFFYYLVDHVEMSPSVQTAVKASANCALGGWLGYWIDRGAFKKIDTIIREEAHAPIDTIIHASRVAARAIIFAACIISLNVKLA